MPPVGRGEEQHPADPGEAPVCPGLQEAGAYLQSGYSCSLEEGDGGRALLTGRVRTTGAAPPRPLLPRWQPVPILCSFAGLNSVCE